jgi:hypothetical protein
LPRKWINSESDNEVMAERLELELSQSPDSVAAVRPDDIIERALWELINGTSGKDKETGTDAQIKTRAQMRTRAQALGGGTQRTQDRAKSVLLANKMNFARTAHLKFDDTKELLAPIPTRFQNAGIRSPNPEPKEPMTSRRHSVSISPESLESLASIEPISHRILGSELLSAFLTQ